MKQENCLQLRMLTQIHLQFQELEFHQKLLPPLVTNLLLKLKLTIQFLGIEILVVLVDIHIDCNLVVEGIVEQDSFDFG